jgi:hypothetical protein
MIILSFGLIDNLHRAKAKNIAMRMPGRLSTTPALLTFMGTSKNKKPLLDMKGLC